MKKIYKLIIGFLLLTSITYQSNAGFPVGKGRWLLVPTYIHYSAKGYWDNNRNFNYFDNGNGKFTSDYLGFYGGYGINRDLDFMFNVPFVLKTYTSTGLLQQNGGLGDVSLGLCYYLSHFDYYRHLSITGSALIPFYKNDSTKVPFLGLGNAGAEVKLGYAGTNTRVLKTTYYDMELGVRQYFVTEGPTQFFANATLGVPLDEDWKLSGTIEGLTSSSTYSNLNTYNTVVKNNINTDYDYVRMTLSTGRRVNRTVSLWGSIFGDVLGRHVGKGSGFSIFAVLKF